MSQITLSIQDDFLYKFLNFLDMLPKDKISIKDDFFAKEINERIANIQNGLYLSHDEMWGKIEQKIKA